MNVAILTPVYNDWQSLSVLLGRLNACVDGAAHTFHLVIVDDASTDPYDDAHLAAAADLFSTLSLVRVRTNLGHQRAIAVGLTWVYQHLTTDAVIIMDSDGEDRPEDVPRLLAEFSRHKNRAAVFAQRKRRTEGLAFSVFYKLYQVLHWILTGLPVRIGNFSVLPWPFVGRLVISNSLWNHYAATAVRLRLQRTELPTSRGSRYFGSSKMNFVALVKHGLSAIAVHSELVGVRLLVICGIGTTLAIGALLLCIWVRYFTTMAIRGWATYVTGLLVIILIQLLSLAFSFCIQALSNQNDAVFLPVRDCDFFIEHSKQWNLQERAAVS